MKRFTPHVRWKLLLILLRISFVCSGQLVLKIWKVSDLYLYQVVQHKSLIYLATSTIHTNFIYLFFACKLVAQLSRWNQMSEI